MQFLAMWHLRTLPMCPDDGQLATPATEHLSRTHSFLSSSQKCRPSFTTFQSWEANQQGWPHRWQGVTGVPEGKADQGHLPQKPLEVGQVNTSRAGKREAQWPEMFPPYFSLQFPIQGNTILFSSFGKEDLVLIFLLYFCLFWNVSTLWETCAWNDRVQHCLFGRWGNK